MIATLVIIVVGLLGAFAVLGEPMSVEQLDDGLWQGNRSAARPGFGFDEDEAFAALALQRSSDRQRGRFEVDVSPLQTERFALT